MASRPTTGIVYLIHFAQPIAHARHYVGYADDLLSRLDQHRNGRGARLLQVANERGIAYEIVRTWSGTRDFERLLKNRKCSPKYCPICKLINKHS